MHIAANVKAKFGLQKRNYEKGLLQLKTVLFRIS